MFSLEARGLAFCTLYHSVISCGAPGKRENMKNPRPFPARHLSLSSKSLGKGYSCVKLAVLPQSKHGVGAPAQEKGQDRVTYPFSNVLWIMTHVEENDSCKTPAGIQAWDSDTRCISECCLVTPGQVTAPISVCFLLRETMMTKTISCGSAKSLDRMNIKEQTEGLARSQTSIIIYHFILLIYHSQK